MAHQVSTSEREAVLRRAILRVKPEYFAWPVAEQERYRVGMPEQDAFRIEQTALQVVRLRHFVRDCRSMAGNPQELEVWAKRECQAVRRFLEETYRDIKQHFDPKVARLRKKRKIILADGAVKDLLSIASCQQEKT